MKTRVNHLEQRPSEREGKTETDRQRQTDREEETEREKKRREKEIIRNLISSDNIQTHSPAITQARK